MKYAALVLVFFVAIALFLVAVYSLSFHKSKIIPLQQKPSSQEKDQSSYTSPSSLLFVPYWTLDGKSLPTYNKLVYFGISADEDGIDTKEDGYLGLSKFAQEAGSQDTLLAVRLLDSDVNEKLLADTTFQQKVASEAVQVAKENGFKGIVLDFEYKALAFDNVVKKTTQLTNTFADTAHESNLLFYQTMYGDVFYRVRPFDIGAIGKETDGIFVMAYDFHKANGNPGPNFPLRALSDEDYSLEQMTKDFISKVDPQKLTIVFGLFGYDWTMNNKDQSLTTADSITTTEAENKFVHCQLKSCRITRDPQAEEEHARYVDSDNRTHDVWFEDRESVKNKENYLKTQGISSIGLWAYSYF